jgi:hypothetical protein
VLTTPGPLLATAGPPGTGCGIGLVHRWSTARPHPASQLSVRSDTLAHPYLASGGAGPISAVAPFMSSDLTGFFLTLNFRILPDYRETRRCYCGGGGPMLTSLSKTAREYRVHAANARALADATADPSTKKHYLEYERYWLDRALDYETAGWFGSKS